MSHAAPGRHRAEPSARRSPNAAGIGALVLVLLLIIGVLAWWLSSRDPDAATENSPTDAAGSTSASPDASVATSRVESERTVTIDGAVVTVEETSTIVDGGAARATPPTAAPVGLELRGATIDTADGRSAEFNSPVKLQPSGSLTVVGRYRLTDCPDLLPTQWPSPSDFPDATRTYPRLEEPLHTAYAICPKAKSQAKILDELVGTVGAGGSPSVKLKWSGSSPLTIETIGATSGVAALATEPGCNGGCVAEIPAGGEETVGLQAVDPCPPATDSDTLTLKLGGGDVVSIDVPDLHQAICEQG